MIFYNIVNKLINILKAKSNNNIIQKIGINLILKNLFSYNLFFIQSSILK